MSVPTLVVNLTSFDLLNAPAASAVFLTAFNSVWPALPAIADVLLSTAAFSPVIALALELAVAVTNVILEVLVLIFLALSAI